MKTRQILVCAVFGAILLLFAGMLLLKPAQDVSQAERRKLAQFQTYADWKPTSGQEKTLAGYFTQLETVCLDQFPARQRLRELRSFSKLHLFFQRDVGGYYDVNGSIGKIDDTLSEAAVTDALGTLQKLDAELFSAANRYYAVIPDKNYHLAAANGYPALDYDALFSMVDEALGGTCEKIDLAPLLTAESYYNTDPHWRQEELLPVADAILQAMNAAPLASEVSWQTDTLSPFYGAYAGHSAIRVQADTLSLLHTADYENVTVAGVDFTGDVYDEADFENVDPYDVYLHGAEALLRIENPTQSNGRKLIILRDSFTSSLAPLLIPAYSEITLVDIRYVAPRMLDKLLTVTADTDVLYLYSTSVLNSFGAFMR